MIHIEFPESVRLLQEAECKKADKEFFTENYACNFNIEANSLVITDTAMGRVPTTWFSKKRGENKRHIKISIEGIRSQRSSRPSETFSFRTSDANNYTIDQSTTFFM